MTDEQKFYALLSIKSIANATRNNSNAIRQLALAQLYRSSGRLDEAASEIEKVKLSLENSDQILEDAIKHMATAMGIEQ